MSSLVNRVCISAILAASTLLMPVNAVAVDQPPRTLADHGKPSQKRIRHYAPKEFIDGQRTGFTCPIALTDPFFGHLSDSAYLVNEKLPFVLGCYHASDTLVSTAWAQPDGLGGWKLKGYEDQLDVMRFYPLDAINAKGWAVTEEDKIGEESGRAKRLHYCLVHEQKALCGQGEMGYVQDIRRHPKNDLTNYTLRILRSIEFIDEPAVPAGALPASAAASAP